MNISKKALKRYKEEKLADWIECRLEVTQAIRANTGAKPLLSTKRPSVEDIRKGS